MHTVSTLPGKLVVFEGPDGSGKSTQASKIHEFCQKNGIDSILTMEPGGTKLGKIVKDLLHSDMDLDPYASLGLLLAARAQHVKEVVRPAIEKGFLVISDRGPLSTALYQGIGKGIPFRILTVLNEASMDGIVPSATIIFTVSRQEALRRTMARDGIHSPYERSESYARVVEGYQKIASGKLKVDQTFLGESVRTFSSEDLSPEQLSKKVIKSMQAMGLIKRERLFWPEVERTAF